MIWSNWIYLGLGLGLGAGASWLLRRQRGDLLVLQTAVSSKKSAASPAPQEATDVPALVEQLKQSQLAYHLAQEMSQFKAGFLARTSHELRSPLNSLIGLHQLILSDLCDDPAEEREFVAQAHESALKLVKLMDEILAVSRIEYGSNPLEIQPLELAWVLEEVYHLTHLLAANRNLPLQILPPAPDIYILADPRWLRQVLVNLVDVSIFQMEQMEGGSICISVQPVPPDGAAYIWLDVQLPMSIWREPVDLLQSEPISQPVNQNAAPSPGMTLLMDQTLLELMRGRLDILSVPTPTQSPSTRLQLTIPLVIPETAVLELEGN